ncbi:Glutaredoxin [Thalictrum thalictroides]|uniref:Glutaredoxin n=1 Tax=Thalictrum thalictroides TaxID=46969 RepID=A0A7J6W9Y2_THATH|nr:Glutaredoxin [Thalictrum thalictroides]
MVLENAVILFGKRGCCMCHAMKRLLLMLGVNPAVHEVDEDEEEAVINELMMIINQNQNQNRDVGKDSKPQYPSMFIGGKLFGGLDKLMAAHISGELVPMLKQAGALWL